MKKLIMMRGLPGSGKSTRAKEIRQEYVEKHWEAYRVNRDLLRKMLHFGVWNPKNEGATVASQNAIVDALLGKPNSGKPVLVIVDDSNLTDRHLEHWKAVAKKHGAEFVMEQMETSVWECIERDAKRTGDEHVGKHAIVRFALESGLIDPVRIVVTDLDGTLADITHRRHHVDKMPKDWNSFFLPEEILKDKVRMDVWNQVAMAHATNSVRSDKRALLVAVSARPERCRQATVEWLEKHGMLGRIDALLMRADRDSRQDDIVKREIHDKYLKNHEVTVVFDDRPRVIRVWRELGLNVEDVGDGVEF